MRLNSLGKSNVSKQIVKCTGTTINKIVKVPIKLDWRTEYDISSNEVTEMDLTSAALSAAGTDNTLDKRIRRKPVTRSTDFLWEDWSRK